MSLLLLAVLASSPYPMNELYVSMVDKDGDVRGTGVRVTQELVLTAAHILPENGPYKVHCPNGLSDMAVVKVDKEKDLALVKISAACTAPIVDIRPSRLNSGDFVYVVGCPNGLCGIVKSGTISSYGHVNGKLFIITEIAIIGGNSGGGMFDAEQNLAGIAHAYVCWDKPAHFCLSLFIPIDTVVQFLTG